MASHVSSRATSRTQSVSRASSSQQISPLTKITPDVPGAFTEAISLDYAECRTDDHLNSHNSKAAATLRQIHNDSAAEVLKLKGELGRSQTREQRAEKKVRELESQLRTEISRKLDERNVLDWALGRLWKMNKNAREIARLERAAEVVADRVADMDGTAAVQLGEALENLRKALEWLPARTRIVRYQWEQSV